jgi:hypothetical protein
MIRQVLWAKNYPVLASSIRAAREQLARMPNWPHVSAFMTVLRAVEDDAAVWSMRPPRPDEQQKMLTKMLGIHFALAALMPRTR